MGSSPALVIFVTIIVKIGISKNFRRAIVQTCLLVCICHNVHIFDLVLDTVVQVAKYWSTADGQ